MLIMNGVPARGVNRYDITIRLPGLPNGQGSACSQKVLKIRHRRKHLRISAFVEETGESPFASLVMPTQADIPKLMSGWVWAHSGRHELLFVLLSLRPWKRERIYHTNPAVFLMQGYILNACGGLLHRRIRHYLCLESGNRCHLPIPGDSRRPPDSGSSLCVPRTLQHPRAC